MEPTAPEQTDQNAAPSSSLAERVLRRLNGAPWVFKLILISVIMVGGAALIYDGFFTYDEDLAEGVIGCISVAAAILYLIYGVHA